MRLKTLSPFWLLFILTGLNFFNYIDRYVVNAVVEPIKGDFHLTDSQAGLIGSAFMLGYFVTAPFFGYLGDRVSRKWLIALGIFVWSAGTILTGLAGTFLTLLAFRMLVGFGEASYASISPSLISDSYASSRRNNALTIFYVAIPVGMACGVLIGSWIQAAWGWRYAFVIAGAPGLILAMCLLPFQEPQRGQSDGVSQTHLPDKMDVFKLLRITDYNLVVWGYVAYTFALGGFVFWGKSYIQRVFEMSGIQAGTFMGTLIAAAGLVSTFAGGFAATQWRKRNSAAYALTLGISTLAAVPFAAWAFLSDSRLSFMIGFTVSILLLFLGTGPVNTLILETVPVNLRASSMALSIFMIHLFGDFWSPEILGMLSDSVGLKLAVLVLPVALLIGGSLWLALGLKTPKRVPALDLIPERPTV